ncbi:MAG: hypothetical protein LBB80_00590 [Treponema sp.]|jgi:hypothetical protein|nr:hypothetical protein [Treponema sp.]
MKCDEVAKLTGYAAITIRKYAVALGIPYTGEDRRKTYHWEERDVARFLEAIRGAGGRHDRRGKPKNS